MQSVEKLAICSWNPRVVFGSCSDRWEFVLWKSNLHHLFGHEVCPVMKLASCQFVSELFLLACWKKTKTCLGFFGIPEGGVEIVSNQLLSFSGQHQLRDPLLVLPDTNPSRCAAVWKMSSLSLWSVISNWRCIGGRRLSASSSKNG